MTLRNRLKDMLPVLVVFFVVTCVATVMVVELVVREPVDVPARAVATGGDDRSSDRFPFID